MALISLHKPAHFFNLMISYLSVIDLFQLLYLVKHKQIFTHYFNFEVIQTIYFKRSKLDTKTNFSLVSALD